ncbi:DNA-directed RNA polymerase subunit RPC12/RpoP [Virgibacillus litoralis]|uniref:DNA-directed RNA polymerase subunit RPC12/RpoP n=1 Tax=Virgibacillus litoralis TaxID=578221 RepID=A0ABS4HHG6_9BACI|nr:DNA-directed RNA polymerase subunit RPC12/RpoP [Virgibacillus litoralis]
MNNAICPECGKQIDDRSYTLECDYCLSKREE